MAEHESAAEHAAHLRYISDMLSDDNLDAHRVSASIQAAIRGVRAALAAANERAEKAEAEAGRLRGHLAAIGAAHESGKAARRELDRLNAAHADALVVENCELRTRSEQAEAGRDEARARLTELSLLRLEWSTANNYYDPGDDIVSELLARNRVASRPEIHAAVVSRQIYAGPWREGACRSCGTDERVAGDPPLCSSCAVYGAGLSAPHAFTVCPTCNGSGGYCQRCRDGEVGLPHTPHIVTCDACHGGGTYPPENGADQ